MSDTPTIESEQFYNLCQAYRHMPITMQKETVAAYQELIAYIDEQSRAREQAARLEEAEWWNAGFHDPDTCLKCQRIAALRAGQPRGEPQRS